MSTYTELKQEFSDFQMVSTSIEETKETLEYLRNAINRRIEADQTEILTKISTMKERLADETMSDPVRRLMEVELTKLQQTTFCPTEAEKEAYTAEIEAMKTAKADLEGMKFDFEEAIADLEAEVAEMKARMSADTTLTDLPNLIAAEQKTFEHLCKEVSL